MKISIVTPSYNRPDYLYETAFSILTQAGDFDLQYIIQDGGSVDGTIAVIKKIEHDFQAGYIPKRCNSITFEWYSEPDKGMYDAITKGFKKTDGSVMAWLNSDDMYHPFALQSVTQIFRNFQEVNWITGIPNSYTKHGTRAGFDFLPQCYSRSYIQRGYYRLDYSSYGFNWIQQESTFWCRSLWEKSGGISSSLKYSADFYLWREFAKHSTLTKVYSFLGGYRFHGNQITSSPELYYSELTTESSPPEGLEKLNDVLTRFEFMKERLLWSKNSHKILADEFGLDKNELIGQYIFWNFGDDNWKIREGTIFDRNYFLPC